MGNYMKSNDRQSQIMMYIKMYLAKHGYPPTVREICQGVELKSPSTVHGYLLKLEARGLIERSPEKGRALHIVAS
jgi:repressor LexA